MKHQLTPLKLLLVAAVALCLSTSTRAATYTVDPNQSWLDLSGLILYHYPDPNFAGLASNPQTAGSMHASWGGTINATYSGGVLTFNPGSVITAQLNLNGPFQPTALGSSTEVNNYGVWSSGVEPGVGSLSITGAYRGLVLDVTGSIQNGVAPSATTFTFTGGDLLFDGFSIALGGAFAGTNGMNTSGLNLTLGEALVAGDGSSFLLPVSFQTTGGSGRVENWTGFIVVPEPSILAVALLGAGFLAARARSRSRRF